ncbi:MAG: preprotein translocase subunit SecG [Planctomycetota bacterium]|jgi:preprotein translocase subunit SecG|nr:preprotein translocase subunit SecG [Planctomycetota bacterium]
MIVRFLLGLFLILSSLFLILLVLIQRGRGGGLAGAFGGAGGQSAFGTKAGDVFTKITIGVAAFWIILCILALNVLGRQQSKFNAATLGGSMPIETGNTGGALPPGETPAPAATPVDTQRTTETPAATPAEGAAAPAPAATDAGAATEAAQ